MTATGVEVIDDAVYGSHRNVFGLSNGGDVEPAHDMLYYAVLVGSRQWGGHFETFHTLAGGPKTETPSILYIRVLAASKYQSRWLWE